MPQLSQRTLGKAIVALTAMLPLDADTYPLMRDFWRTKLFERGFPAWLVDFVLARSMNWSVIIPELFDGTVRTREQVQVGYAVCHAMLPRLTVMAFEESRDRSTQEALRLSLQLDGFEVGKEQLRPIDGPVSAEEEKSRLLVFLKASKLGRQDVISKHLTDTEDLFSQGKHHSAIGEARSALQAVIEETVVLFESKVQSRSGSGTKNKIDFLAKQNILSNDEQHAFVSAWAFLSSGNHPGLPSEDAGRIGIILCLELVQVLVIKCKNLL